jgi:hypothetical protein
MMPGRLYPEILALSSAAAGIAQVDKRPVVPGAGEELIKIAAVSPLRSLPKDIQFLRLIAHGRNSAPTCG